MTFRVKSLAAFSPDTPLQPYDLERRTVLPDDVVIDILYCGVCHSDIHFAHNDYKMTHYPFVPGHEIVGRVSETGDQVTKVTLGDLVGVGCVADACDDCEYCKKDEEVFCTNGVSLSVNGDEKERFPGHFYAGGFSEKIVIREKMVLVIPKALQTPDLLPGVAPILCSGITAYSPLSQFKIGKNAKVAVVGMGGLGNFSVRLAKALGAEVTVISRSHGKDEAALAAGAIGVLASTSDEDMQKGASQFDFILDTIPFDHDVNPYGLLLKPQGTLCIIGHIGPLTTPLNGAAFLTSNRRIAFSCIGSIAETQALLDLCAKNQITAPYDLIPAAEVNGAWEKVEEGSTSQRFVVDISTLPSVR